MKKKALLVAILTTIALLGITTTVFAQMGAGWYDIYSDVRMRGSAEVWSDLSVGDDLSVADDFIVVGDTTVAGLSVSGVGAFDDVTVAGQLTSLGAPMTVVTATGTITPVLEGVYLIASGGAAATLTIIDPGTSYNGMRLTFISLEGTAHKVVADTVGFNAGNAGTDTCTWSTAIGNSLEVILYEGEWYILNSTNCTLG